MGTECQHHHTAFGTGGQEWHQWARAVQPTEVKDNYQIVESALPFSLV